MNFGTDIHGLLSLNCYNFGNLLTFSLALVKHQHAIIVIGSVLVRPHIATGMALGSLPRFIQSFCII